ncbi:MAG: deoxyribose-phosphate aldolase [Armatimonadetes bacterium]|nr:deoxyribose-phosphate aldolase [Armatimonadota bacterium]
MQIVKNKEQKPNTNYKEAQDLTLLIYKSSRIEFLKKIIPILKNNKPLSLLLSSSSRIYLDESIKKEFKEIIFAENNLPPWDEFNTLIFPLLELNNLSKLVNLIDDTWEIKFILEALQHKKEVLVLSQFLKIPSVLKFKVNGFLKELEKLNIKLIELSNAELSKLDCSAKSGECSSCGSCHKYIQEKVNYVVDAGADRISSTLGINVKKELAGLIDHTLLKPDATSSEIVQMCEEAKKYDFASVCVNPGWVKLAAKCLANSKVLVCTVIGFPLGATTSIAKAMETRDAVANGAQEIDMVINVGALKAGDYELVKEDIKQVVASSNGKIVKVIIEAALLTDNEKVKACLLAKEAGADFVKTSTGFGPGGATVSDVALMRKTVGKYMGVKASGGIRDFQTAQKMIQAGATRIGASASVAIIKGEKLRNN